MLSRSLGGKTLIRLGELATRPHWSSDENLEELPQRNGQDGALSFVPKYTKLAGGAIYAGIPAKRIE